MPLVAADYQAQILAEVGDPNRSIAPLMVPLWALHADGIRALDVVALYVKRGALDIRLAEESSAIDTRRATADGAFLEQDATSQRFTHLLQMRADVQAEIVRIEIKSRASRASVSGTLAATAPTSPPFPDTIDRNDPRFTGDPYTPRRLVR